jgi:hypothetical protein
MERLKTCHLAVERTELFSSVVFFGVAVNAMIRSIAFHLSALNAASLPESYPVHRDSSSSSHCCPMASVHLAGSNEPPCEL